MTYDTLNIFETYGPQHCAYGQTTYSINVINEWNKNTRSIYFTTFSFSRLCLRLVLHRATQPNGEQNSTN